MKKLISMLLDTRGSGKHALWWLWLTCYTLASKQQLALEVLHSLSTPREIRLTAMPAQESDMLYGISMDTHPPLTAHALSCCALRHRLLASRPLVRRRGAPPLAGFTGFSSSPQVASCVEKIFLFLIIKQ